MFKLILLGMVFNSFLLSAMIKMNLFDAEPLKLFGVGCILFFILGTVSLMERYLKRKKGEKNERK